MKMIVLILFLLSMLFNLSVGTNEQGTILLEEPVAVNESYILSAAPQTSAMATANGAVRYDMEMEDGGFFLDMAYDDTSYEEYTLLKDTGFVNVFTNPLSTFAADVDTASYANVRRMINNQQPIQKDAVRIEELVNSFSYTDAVPTDEKPLAIHTMVAACPWNEDNLLLRIAVKAAKIETDDLPPSNLVFLIDSSGSMDSPDKLPLVQRSFALLTEQLRPEDRVSIVTYAGNASVVLEGVHGDQKAQIINAINDIGAGGSTAGAEGIETAYQIAARYAAPGINSRILLATDGDFNVGINSEAELTRFIEMKKDEGIFLTVLGYGMGNIKDNKMQALAEHGNGNASYIDTIHQARQALIEEMGATLVTVAKDVKLQVEFNPATVEGYRLIGYETRRMADEDFRDDTKDGGEIGSGHTVVALYELISAKKNAAPESTLTYQKSVAGDSTDYATVYLRYKEPDSGIATEIKQAVGVDAYTSMPDNNFNLSAAVAAFGQLLAGSDYAGSADEQMILNLLQPMLTNDTGGRIVELSTLVRKSNGLYEQ